MSNIYNLEPPTKGKVVLHTNKGPLDIELWPKEAPKAVRNFVQLCLEGHYDRCIFHRIIKDYIIQGGDPTGTGTGGESIYGQPFKDEFHSRLRFTHRGLLACANQNSPHTNGSQFFITLDKAEQLDKKNTIFGKVVGDTIYNLLRLAEVEVDDDDRPIDAPFIKSVEVLWNPFEDIVPRTLPHQEDVEEDPAKSRAKKRKTVEKKKLGLLSFGEEAEEGEQEEEEGGAGGAGGRAGLRSAHDVLEDSRLQKTTQEVEEELARMREAAATRVRDALKKGSQAGAGALSTKDAKEDGGEDSKGGGSDFGMAMRERAASKRREMEALAATKSEPSGERKEEAGGERRRVGEAAKDLSSGPQGRHEKDTEDDEDEEDEEEDDKRPGSSGRGVGVRAGMNVKGKVSFGRVKTNEEVVDADLLKPYQIMREKYKQKKRLLGDREKATMSKLMQFQDKLRSKENKRKEEADLKEKQEDKGGEDQGYAGQVRADLDHRAYMPPAWRVDDYMSRDEDIGLEELRGHRLEFTKETNVTDAMARRDDVDDYVVFDPLLEQGKGKFSKANQKVKKQQTEWAGRSRDKKGPGDP